MTGRRTQWRRLIAGEPGDEILCDLGTSTVSGLRAFAAPEMAGRIGRVGHPVMQTLAFDADDTAALGSDFVRAGLLYERPVLVDDTFTDAIGTSWLWHQRSLAPLDHPLETADLAGIARHPRPDWPGEVQVEHHPTDRVVVADAPCSGIFEMAFLLRGHWRLLNDIADNWRVANALLDWTLDTVTLGFEATLRALPDPPDLILYGDDFGYADSMFVNQTEFRQFLRPRLRTLFSRIRKIHDAPIFVHTCGAIRPILPDLAELGVAGLNLQYDARDMVLGDIRREIPGAMVLHGFTDTAALGRAIRDRDRRGVAVLLDELVGSMPAVAAPTDCLDDIGRFHDAARAHAAVGSLTPGDIDRVRRLGPVSDVVDHVIEIGLATPEPELAGRPPHRGHRATSPDTATPHDSQGDVPCRTP